jgi:hypothetical protein
MSGQERLNEFLQAIDEWISCKNLPNIEPVKDIEDILNMGSADLNALSSRECLGYAYELYAYAEYLESIKAKEKIVLEWADSSIWYIISQSLDDYGGSYTKWEQKYYSAVKENPLASEILKIKKHAESRVSMMDGKSNRVQKMADTLSNLSRIK